MLAALVFVAGADQPDLRGYRASPEALQGPTMI